MLNMFFFLIFEKVKGIRVDMNLIVIIKYFYFKGKKIFDINVICWNVD